MQRNELVIRAAAVGLDPSTHPNDSKLEQKVLWLEKNATAFSGTLASGTLTGTAQSVSGDETLIGGVTYKFVTALSEAHATSTLTTNGTTPTDGDTVTIDGTTYVFRTALTNGGTAPYEVFINGSAANALINLKAAINASGTAGTTYGVGTLVHQTVNATTLTTTTLVVVANALGVAGNFLLTSTVNSGSTLSWTGTNLSGGVNPVANEVLLGAALTNQLANLKSAINGSTGAGSTYSSATVANTQVTAGAATSTTLVVNAVDYSVTNTGVPTTNPVGTALSWGSTALTGGVRNQIAVPTTTYGGEAGVSGDKDI